MYELFGLLPSMRSQNRYVARDTLSKRIAYFGTGKIRKEKKLVLRAVKKFKYLIVELSSF